MIITDHAYIRRIINQAIIDKKTCHQFNCGGMDICTAIFCSRQEPFLLNGVTRRIPCAIFVRTTLIELLKGEIK